MRHIKPDDLKKRLAFAHEITAWLGKAGVTEVNGAPFADIIFACECLEAELLGMMQLNLEDPAHAMQARVRLRNMHALLFTEIASYIEELKHAWPHLEKRLHAKERQGLRRLKGQLKAYRKKASSSR